jgi:hypothetical protein
MGYSKMMENRKVRIEREKEKEKNGENLNDASGKAGRKTYESAFPDINNKNIDENVSATKPRTSHGTK